MNTSILDRGRGQDVIQRLESIETDTADRTTASSFFNGPAQFEYLKAVAKMWFADGQRRFRIWSSACGTGEEAYSIAMTFLDSLPENAFDLRVFATDCSSHSIARATQAQYTPLQISNLPDTCLNRHFVPAHVTLNKLSLNEGVVDLVRFERWDLLDTPFPLRGPLDAVFCFNAPSAIGLQKGTPALNEFARLLKPTGYLFTDRLGQGSNSDEFDAVAPGVFQKKNSIGYQ